MESEENVSIPRWVIAAPHGRSGKTTATLALVGAFAARGLVVQPFKKGPDYIDPSWLSAAANRAARNLDPFMMRDDALVASVTRAARETDIAIIEGNHGLFDSLDEDGSGSTAALARLLRAPILLVVDAARMGRSVAALVDGYQYFEPDTRIAGVILNNVAHARHAAKLQSAVEAHCGIPVLGILPRDQALAIADRHLGLIPRGEYAARARAPLDALRRAAEEFFDLDAILEIANTAPPFDRPSVEPAEKSWDKGVNIGILRDAAFTFYYPENLEALEDAGAELVFIDALRDPRLPAVDALYIGGGFPEVFAAELEANAGLRADLRAAIENDLPVYAECGGLMYLARSLSWHDQKYAMVGALPCDIEIMDTPQGHGYVQARVAGDNPFFARETILRGHEYHHSRVVHLESSTLAYSLTRGRGIGESGDGIVYRNVLAAYTHLHALGTPQWATALVGQAVAYRASRVTA
jgi:cobyrinic acid a,c-diamide synthase